MKCQKNKECPKRPSTAIPLPDDAKFCTGCSKPSKDVTPKKHGKKASPLTEVQISSSINILGFFKDSVFGGDHPGIDKMVKEMQDVLKKRKTHQKVKRNKCNSQT